MAKLAIVAGIVSPFLLRNEWAIAGGWLIIGALAYLLALDREALDRREKHLEELARKQEAVRGRAAPPQAAVPRLAAPDQASLPDTLH